MTTTNSTPPTNALALWWLVPHPVRLQLRARPQLDARVTGDDHCALITVGPQNPLRWLLLSAVEDGIRARLWQVVPGKLKVLEVADETVNSDLLVLLLQRWSRDYLN